MGEDQDQCFHAFRKLAGFKDGVKNPVESRKVQRVERKHTEQRAMEW